MDYKKFTTYIQIALHHKYLVFEDTDSLCINYLTHSNYNTLEEHLLATQSPVVFKKYFTLQPNNCGIEFCSLHDVLTT